MTLQEQASSEAVLGAEEAALKELSDKIMAAAITDGASDIHIDPETVETRVRFRIDGVMQDVVTVPRNVHDPLVTRFKTLADLDTGNRKSLQSGRISVEYEEREYDLRETVLPSFLGEKVTLRVLDRGAGLPGLDKIGYREADRKRLEQCLQSPNGCIVFCGPTGCGKTTTMYVALQRLISPCLALFSIEDPVEYRLPGVVQIQVNRKAGLGFAEILRGGIVRSDPDIIMVGEVPDLATGELCFQAALTGHLVMTQLHAKDAAGGIQRLLDMGVESFIISSALLMVSAQRLVRRICGECKQEVKYPAELVAEWRQRAEAGGLAWPAERPAFYKGRGCDHCRGTGYYGRRGIYEILLMDHELAEMVSTRADISEIRDAAIRKGMTTMLADGMAKAIAGETTAEEVLRVLGG